MLLGRFIFFTSGNYQYTCPGIGSGNVTVVPAKHNIPFCKQCSIGMGLGSELQQHSINVGDVVQWTLALQEQEQNCTMLIRQLRGGNQSMSVFYDYCL